MIACVIMTVLFVNVYVDDNLEGRGLREEATLPRSIYDAARATFISDWPTWCQPLSVRTDLAMYYPQAYHTEGGDEYRWNMAGIGLQDTKRADYFIDDILLDEHWKE